MRPFALKLSKISHTLQNRKGGDVVPLSLKSTASLIEATKKIVKVKSSVYICEVKREGFL